MRSAFGVSKASEESKRKAKRAAIIAGSAAGGGLVGNLPMTGTLAGGGALIGGALQGKGDTGRGAARGAAAGAMIAHDPRLHRFVLSEAINPPKKKKHRIMRTGKGRAAGATMALLPVAGAVTAGGIAAHKTKVKKSEDESKESMAHEKAEEKTEGCGCKNCEEKEISCKDCPKCSSKRIHL